MFWHFAPYFLLPFEKFQETYKEKEMCMHDFCVWKVVFLLEVQLEVVILFQQRT